MTSIVAWAGVDSRGPASVYIASDSRITWGTTHMWDRGRKTFRSVSAPYIFGYSGDVLFPSMAIPIVLEQLTSGVIPTNPKSAFGKIGSQMRQLWLEYPQQERRDLAVVMAARTGEKMTAKFSVALLTYKADDGDWDLRDEPMPTASSSLVVGGSGAAEIRTAERLWQSSAHANTSRAVFSAFCESVQNGRDPLTGGARNWWGCAAPGTE